MTTNNDKMGLLTLVGSVPAHLHQLKLQSFPNVLKNSTLSEFTILNHSITF